MKWEVCFEGGGRSTWRIGRVINEEGAGVWCSVWNVGVGGDKVGGEAEGGKGGESQGWHRWTNCV